MPALLNGLSLWSEEGHYMFTFLSSASYHKCKVYVYLGTHLSEARLSPYEPQQCCVGCNTIGMQEKRQTASQPNKDIKN